MAKFHFIMPHVWKHVLRYAGDEVSLTPAEARELAGRVEPVVAVAEAPAPQPVMPAPPKRKRPELAEEDEPEPVKRKGRR